MTEDGILVMEWQVRLVVADGADQRGIPLAHYATLPLIHKGVHCKRVHRVLTDGSLVLEICLVVLILPLDTASRKKVFTKSVMLGILCDLVQTEDGKLQLGMARIAVSLVWLLAKVLHKALDVL